MVMGSTSGTTTSWVKNFVQTNGWNYVSNIKASVDSTVWNTYGFGSTEPYKVLIDRDGNLRAKGTMFDEMQQTVDECLGI